MGEKQSHPIIYKIFPHEFDIFFLVDQNVILSNDMIYIIYFHNSGNNLYLQIHIWTTHLEGKKHRSRLLTLCNSRKHFSSVFSTVLGIIVPMEVYDEGYQ